MQITAKTLNLNQDLNETKNYMGSRTSSFDLDIYDPMKANNIQHLKKALENTNPLQEIAELQKNGTRAEVLKSKL